MTKTLQIALAPLSIIGAFCSLGIFEYPLGRPRPYFSCLYTLITWSCFTYSFYYPFYTEQWDYKVADFMEIIIFTTSITSIFVSHFHFEELRMCLHELSVVNDTLEALSVPKEYQRLRNWTIRIIIGWIFYIFYILLLVTFKWKIIHNKPMYFVDIYRIFLVYYPVFINILSALIWGIILGLVYRVSKNDCQISCTLIERTKLIRKFIYHFAIFALVNKILKLKIIEWFLIRHYQLYRKTSDKNCLFSSHRVLTRGDSIVTLIDLNETWRNCRVYSPEQK
ncbi:hypothetical protein ALC60_02032 [Trachymyrmex zeteki]|uniref:Gustatory receptor n=1 Tax=Mycetomoellerius zeteki TaxID=64791 RepID=A0A151XEU2_9HYME|nr:hypothetical protein ALC60_02032 [Trachymyrmex zeteki]